MPNGTKQKIPFQAQLKQQALKKIIVLVIVGCLLFCIPVFWLNSFNLYLNLEKHLDFLNRTVDAVYDSVADYLDAAEADADFLQCMGGAANGREVQYSVNRYNVASPIHAKVILLNRDFEIAYSSFAKEEMNLHRVEFNRIVAVNSLHSSDPVYTAVYYFSGSYSECVFVRPVYRDGAPYGFIAVYLDGEGWGPLVSQYQYDSIITNQNGDIIYCSKTALFPERRPNKFIAAPGVRTLTVNGLSYRTASRTLVKEDVLLHSFVYTANNWLYVVIGVGTITLLGSIWLFMFLRLSKQMAEKTAQSVEVLVKEIRTIRHSNSEHIIQIETGDEFDEIATQINKMVKSINELNSRNTDLITLNSMIEMRNLQTQINPHFVYNTLDNIKYLILTDAAKAANLIESFTHILRYSINNTKQTPLLSEDFAYIGDYLSIQKTRFGERFCCTVEVAPECQQCRIPKLLLQPLIENSLKYGFAQKMEVAVSIRAWCEERYLYIEAADDGPGVPPALLGELQRMIVSETIQTEHNGLQNLSRRIMLEYGQGCGLFISSVEGKSFTVTAKLLRRGGNDV